MSKATCFGFVLLLSASVAASAQASPDHQLDSPQAIDVEPGSVILLPMPPTIEAPEVAHAQGLRIVYVNFDGVTLTTSGSADDATTDRTAIPVATGFLGPGQSLTIPTFQPNQLGDNGNGLSRDQVIARVIQDLYNSHAPYNIEFVTERPASGNYSMVVVGSSCAGVTGMNGCGGIALLDCGDVQAPNNITFMFPPGLAVGHIASVSAQEAAHAFGLSHTDDGTDIMFPSVQQFIPTSYGSGNVVMDGQPNCGQSFQDSDALMLSTIGPRGQDTVPPAVTISSPGDGAIVSPGATVSATVTDNVMVQTIESFVDGVSLGQQGAGSVSFALPSTATSGTVDIEVRATDSSGNVGTASITVEISTDGNEGNLGELCLDGSECDSRLCGAVDGEMRCTRECSETSACPAGFECLGGTACWPEQGGGCLGCGSSGTGGGSLALIAIVALIGFRRRR